MSSYIDTRRPLAFHHSNDLQGILTQSLEPHVMPHRDVPPLGQMPLSGPHSESVPAAWQPVMPPLSAGSSGSRHSPGFANEARQLRSSPDETRLGSRQSRRSDHSVPDPPSWVTVNSDLDEDLAECIAAWQESTGSRGGHAWDRGDAVPGRPSNQPGFAGAPLDFGRLQATQKSPKYYSGGQAQYNQDPFSPITQVNVGGAVFRTTAATLRKARFFDSMMKYAEEGAMGTTVDDGGRLFVDRSSELFGYILEYLRSGNWVLRDKAGDHEFVDALREEAGFYGIDDMMEDTLPVPRIAEYVTVWQFREDTSLYVDSHEQTIREDPDHQGLFRLCKYSGGLPLDQQTCTKRFKATSHSVQSIIAYFAMRGFRLQHVVEGSMITHTTSVDGQSRSGHGVQYILSRQTQFSSTLWEPPNTQRGSYLPLQSPSGYDRHKFPLASPGGPGSRNMPLDD